MPSIDLQSHFIDSLPADPVVGKGRRQVSGACYSFVNPSKVRSPTLVAYSSALAGSLGIKQSWIESDEFVQAFSGNELLSGSKPYAMCYGGHQFGNWAGQLGDGRAINLGEIASIGNTPAWTLQLKGSGETPYSRSADGLAVLRSSIREFVCSEAMYHLGIPTTRALSLIETGEQVHRDMLYDGNAAMEPGAIICRAAPSFIRFGSFEILAARKEFDLLKQLADFTVSNYFTELIGGDSRIDKNVYLAWFESVMDKTIEMIVHWERVGFVHGVMNTDNMSILGLTIDYGPYGWLDVYEPEWTPNTTDAGSKRYRFDQQAQVAFWNLAQLGNALFPLIEDEPALVRLLESYRARYRKAHQTMMLSKLGLQSNNMQTVELVESVKLVLSQIETDMTLFYRLLAAPIEQLNSGHFEAAFYNLQQLDDEKRERLQKWITRYKQAVQEEKADEKRIQGMNSVNPKYIFRNYIAQQAIDRAHQGDYKLIDEIMSLIEHPYTEQQGGEHFAQKRPEWARDKVGCSMLSCSS